MKNNIYKYYIYVSLYAIANMFCTGTILQSFLLERGFTEDQVYLYNALIQGVQVVTMFALLFFSDKIRRIKLVMGITLIAHTLLSGTLIILANLTDNNFMLYAVYGVSIIVYIATGVYGVISYCLPYRIIDMKSYGTLVGLSTTISGIVTFTISLLYSYVISKAEYSQVMMFCFLFATLCFAVAGYACLSLKEINTDDNPVKKGGYKELFKNKNVYILMLPSFLRGLTMGVVSLLTVIGFSEKLLNPQLATYVNIVLQVASFLANILFVALYKKLSSGRLLLISSLGISIFLPIILLFRNSAWFIFIYFLVYFFLMTFNTAVPVIVPDIVPQDQIGGFTSIRMMLFTFGSMVASFIITPIMNDCGVTALFIFVSVIQFICGSVHYGVWKNSVLKKKKQKQMNEIETVITQSL